MLRALHRQAETADEGDWYVSDIDLECGVYSVSNGSILALLDRPEVIDPVHGRKGHDFLGHLRAHIDQDLVEPSNARISVVRDELRVLFIQGRLVLNITTSLLNHKDGGKPKD